MDLRDHVVPYSTGFCKVEINQINALLARLTNGGGWLTWTRASRFSIKGH